MKKWYATDMLGVPEQAVAEKCANDSQVTLALYWEWVRQIDNEYHDYFEIEMQSIPIILRMSNRGLKIDQHRRQQLIEIKTREVDYYRNLCDGLGFKPGSPQQVAFILMKRGTHLPMRRQKNQTTGKWGWKVTTDEDALEMLDDPVASWVLEYRKNKQLLSTFLLPYDGKDRIYTNFNFDAKVGRISSSNINLQNVPPAKTGKDAAGLDPIVAAGPRAMILPDTGCFTNADASQEHLRILSHRSGDEAMMYIYSQPTYLEDGSKNPEADIHTFLAKRAGISRKLAKTSNYTICYGADAKTLMGATKIKSVQQNEHLITLWSMTFPTAWKWLMEAQAYGVRTGWSMPTLFGRRIKLPPIEVDGIDGVKRKGANYPILGSDGEIMKRALIHCQDMPLALTVHDSMMFDGDVKDELLRRMDYLSHISEVYIPWDIQQTLTWE
jgi:DNA polymerase I-like protein with 3'-5' exonuclease and polymerase domains